MDAGLTDRDAAARLVRDGPNALPPPPQPSFPHMFARQWAHPLVAVLLVAVGLEGVLWWMQGAHGWPTDVVLILIVLVCNAALGSWQEYRADRSVAQLHRLAAPHAQVRRGGRVLSVPAAEVVEGDIAALSRGLRVVADGVVIEAAGLSVDESMLTGESVPRDHVRGDTLASGTLVVGGHGWMRVTATGLRSQMGQLTTLMSDLPSTRTPLRRELEALGRRLALGAAVLAVLVWSLWWWAGDPGRWLEGWVFTAALAVAFVPESLPAVTTLVLALGVERMARRKAVVRRLEAVESLGVVDVIATDKTGTLTEGRMDVESVDAQPMAAVLEAMVLCSDAPASGGADPLESALMRWAIAHGVDPAACRSRYARTAVEPFDSARKTMSVTVCDADGRESTWYKGAPERLLALCALSEEERRAWSNRVDAHARTGGRILGFALRRADEPTRFLGVARLWDPPRVEVLPALSAAKRLGVEVKMITGDHPLTARSIADGLGLGPGVCTGDALEGPEGYAAASDVAVFARVSPTQKLAIVHALQGAGHTVAVMGDGINDAPALKAADVGIAMGIRGSDVSREVADLVLLDDNMATLVAAIEEGRTLRGNLRLLVMFLLSANIAEAFVLVLSLMAGWWWPGAPAMPFNAAQILWINLVTDAFPALALAVDRRGAGGERPERALLSRQDVRQMFLASLMLTAACMMSLLWPAGWWGSQDATAATRCFTVLVLGQWAMLLAFRWRAGRGWPTRWLGAALAVSALLQGAVVTLPSVSAWWSTPTLRWQDTSVIVALLAVLSVGMVLTQRDTRRGNPPAGAVKE